MGMITCTCIEEERRRVLEGREALLGIGGGSLGFPKRRVVMMMTLQ